jgi:DNA-binding response OmpR family regulator
VKILVVDDDPDLRALVSYALRQAGYLAVEAGDGRAALELCERERPDLVVLDVNLPLVDGFEVLRRLRAQPGPARGPRVLMLTVRSNEEDEVKGLDLGADDYLTKPFSPRTLLARVRALLRRAPADRPAPLLARDLALDVEGQSVSVRGGPPVRLTGLELRLLQLLVANAGRPVPTERLANHVWGDRGIGDRQLLKQLVHRLRQKIEENPAAPDLILTAPGVGYLVPPASPKPG